MGENVSQPLSTVSCQLPNDKICRQIWGIRKIATGGLAGSPAWSPYGSEVRANGFILLQIQNQFPEIDFLGPLAVDRIYLISPTSRLMSRAFTL